MIKYSVFKGEIPKMAPHLLPEGYGQTAKNCAVDTGALSVAQTFDLTHDISAYTTSPETVFKFEGRTLQNVEKIAWLWWDKDVDIVKGERWQGADRIFFSDQGDSPPQQTILDKLGSAAQVTEDISKIKKPAGDTEQLPLACDTPYISPSKQIYYTWGSIDKWEEGVAYSAGDVRRYVKTLVWRCKVAHTPNTVDEYPSLSVYTQTTCPQVWNYLSTYWEIVFDAEPTSIFSGSTAYAQGDIMCVTLEYPFRCIQDHVSDNPEPDHFEYKEYSSGDLVQFPSADDINSLLIYERNSTSHSSGVPPTPHNTTYWTEYIDGDIQQVTEKNNTPGFGRDWADFWVGEYSGDSLGYFAYAYTFVTAWGAETRPSPILGPFNINERELIGITIPRDTNFYVTNNGFPQYVTHVRLYRTITGAETGTDFYYVPYYTRVGDIDGKMQFGSNKDGMPIEDVIDGKQYYDCGLNADGTLPDDLDITINQMLEEAMETLFYAPPPEKHFDSSGDILDFLGISYANIADWEAGQTFISGRYVETASKVYRAIQENEDIEPGVTLNWADSWEYIMDAPARSEYLMGLTSLPGGILAAFIDDTLYFSEPYMPHAWPRRYERPLKHKIVGISVFGQDAIICTEGFPYLLTGTHPDAYTVNPLPFSQACLSKHGIVSTPSGVAYPSPDGLFMIYGNETALLTRDLFTKKQWNELSPESIHAEFYDNHYVGIIAETNKILLLNLTSSNGVVFLEIPTFSFISMYRHHTDDALYFLGVSGGDEYISRFNMVMDTTVNYTWKSKQIFLPRPTSLSCMGVVIGSGSVTIKLYCDGVLKMTKTITETSVFKLPPVMGVKWEVELTGLATVYSFEIGTSMEELRNG